MIGSMPDSSILLTGGTGFFGKALLRHWQEVYASTEQKRHKVTVLTRSISSFLSQHPRFSGLPWLHFAEGDVTDAATLPHGQYFTHVLHAAAESTRGPSQSPLERYLSIVDGAKNVLDFAVASKVKRFLLTSSGGVYGAQPVEMPLINESYLQIPDPLNAQSAYSIAKRTVEHLCVLYQSTHSIETIIARCFAFVGQDLPQEAHFAIGNFIRDALGRSQITVAGDGSAVRSYMDQRDLAQWLITLLFKGRAGQAYNVGSDVPISISEVAHKVRNIIAPHKSILILGKVDLAAVRNYYVPCIDKARSELGLNLNWTLDQSIHSLLDYSKLGS
jgi:dTDP-glucose 4,6-dehydratase